MEIPLLRKSTENRKSSSRRPQLRRLLPKRKRTPLKKPHQLRKKLKHPKEDLKLKAKIAHNAQE
jgi:hypothetical protein